MGFVGKRPTVNTIKYTPRVADPVNPVEGELQYADGTARNEGLWVYTDGAWTQISTGATLSVLPNLTLTPQASDPGSPVVGMLFSADGTSRAAGLWIYTSGGWEQLTGVKYVEYTYKETFEVRAASTANVTLASQVENGDSFGGVTLVTGNFVLLKNQTTATENGVYIVAASGAPTRHTQFDTFSELNLAVVYVTEGTNAKNIYYQTATLTSLSDNQVWSTTPANFSFTVPANIYEVDIFAGGGGAGGGGGGSGDGGGGGGGGGAGTIAFRKLKVTPGESLTVTIAGTVIGGNGGVNTTNATPGTSGNTTSILGSLESSYWYGGGGGGAGGRQSTIGVTAGLNTVYQSGGTANSGGGGGAGGIANSFDPSGGTSFIAGSNGGLMNGGGGGGASSGLGSAGGAGGKSEFSSSTASGGSGAGQAGGGGGGGTGISIGGAGGNSSTVSPTNGASAPVGSCAGGGGGGGFGANTASFGGAGGRGASGFMRISW
jgi:hypothetical protein